MFNGGLCPLIKDSLDMTRERKEHHIWYAYSTSKAFCNDSKVNGFNLDHYLYVKDSSMQKVAHIHLY